MRLEGTAAPVEITVDGTFTAAMLQVTANLTGEHAAELLEEARETARLAGLARALPTWVREDADTRVSE